MTHIALWHRNDLMPLFYSFNPWSKNKFLVHDAVSICILSDIRYSYNSVLQHYEKMKVYKQIPRWWYVIVLLGAYAIAQASKYIHTSHCILF